ncbi:hypothetical protein DM01DRAFT_1407800 [Hesseltinella vesiculosa]|uniref:Uncharacterized protein n=1 Tax=Hesseltinella vesiculosa TaxID=101127 RepID=A0A1X2GH63_9FUNG|nr:hypothetical protein DM01DRAFT_1407800 [Hesseltinella vesiculosa]
MPPHSDPLPTYRQRSGKRRTALDALEDTRLRHKRLHHAAQGLDKASIDVIIRGESSLGKTNYKYFQDAFVKWSSSITPPVNPYSPSPSDIMTFISRQRSARPWQPPTCATAKFAILALITDKSHRQMIMSDASFTEYFAALRRTHIRLAPYSRFDITPVLDSVRTDHDNPQLSLRIITAKVCFLLGIMGFLCAADLNTIDRDDSYIHVVTGHLHLSIINPKERRQGFSITKEITIAPFAQDPMLPWKTKKKDTIWWIQRIGKQQHVLYTGWKTSIVDFKNQDCVIRKFPTVQIKADDATCVDGCEDLLYHGLMIEDSTDDYEPEIGLFNRRVFGRWKNVLEAKWIGIAFTGILWPLGTRDKPRHVKDHIKGAYGCFAMLMAILKKYPYADKELMDDLRLTERNP